MNKLINITGITGLGLLLISLITFLIGVLWDTPNEGLVHNLFRYLTTIGLTVGSIWLLLFCYRETVLDNF